MKKASFIQIHKKFIDWIVWYGDFIYKIINAKHIVKSSFEKREIVEALVLRVHVRWEQLVIENIQTSMNLDSSAFSEAIDVRLRKHLPLDECKAILHGHKYFNISNIDGLKQFGKEHLVPKYNPFKGISSSTAKKINEFIIMRNLLAHYSRFGNHKYRKIIKKNYSFKRIPEPGAFLKARINNKKYRWADYLGCFVNASRQMLRQINLIP